MERLGVTPFAEGGHREQLGGSNRALTAPAVEAHLNKDMDAAWRLGAGLPRVQCRCEQEFETASAPRGSSAMLHPCDA